MHRLTICNILFLLVSAPCLLSASQLLPGFGIELFEGRTGVVSIASTEMQSSAVMRGDGCIRMEWRGHPRLGAGFSAVADGVVKGDAVEWTFSCSGNASGIPYGRIAFPVVDAPCADGAALLYSPDAGGGTMGWKRKFRWSRFAEGREIVSTLSPGFRFVSILNGESADSHYLDIRDPVSNSGRFTVAKGVGGTVRLQWFHDVPLAPSNSVAYRLPFPARVRSFRGDWFEAASYYREWVKTTPRYRAAKARDKSKVREIGLWMWNRGLAETVIPPVERFQSDTGLQVALDWYWWFKEMPGTFYPDYWPPREGAAKFKADVQRLKRMGVFTQVYLNGMTWDESVPSWKDGGLESVAMRRDGSYFSCAYNRFNPTHRLANLCGEAPMFHSRIRHQIAHLVDAGFDSIYLDMIGCNAYGPCFNPAHSHNPGGGTHMTDNYRAYLSKVKRDFPGVFLSTEDSGEAYVDIFDSHISTHSSYERHGWIGTAPDVEFIPVFQALYHGCVAVFGNYAIVDNVPYWDPRWPMKPWWTGHEDHLRREYPDQFAVEFSRGPVWGLQPSVHNFWLHHATNASTAAEYRFICDTAHFFRMNRAFLFDGEMCAPGRLDCARQKVDFAKVSVFDEKVASHSSVLPVIFHNVWRSPDGRVSAILVNWTREPQRWKLSAPDVSGEGRLPPRSWKRIDACIREAGLRKGERVVIIGDSLTNQGLAVRDGGYYHRLTNAIARVHGEGYATVIPLGFSGWHVPSWIETEKKSRTRSFRYDTCGKFWDVKDVFDAGADIAVVFLGMNDILRPVMTDDDASRTAWTERYRSFIAALRARLKPRRVLICTISPLTGDPQSRKNEVRREINGRIRTLAREENCAVVEIDRALDPLNDEVRRLWKSHLAGDFVHPSWGVGHAAIARSMAESLGEWEAEKLLAGDVRRETDKVLSRADAFTVNQAAFVASLKPEADAFEYEISWMLKAKHGSTNVSIDVPEGWRVIATNTVSHIPFAFEPRYFNGMRGYFTVRGAPTRGATPITLTARCAGGMTFKNTVTIPAPWRARNNGGEWRILSPSWDYCGWGNAAAVDPFQSFFGSTNETLTVFRRVYVPTARKGEIHLSTKAFSARLDLTVRMNGVLVGSRKVRTGQKTSVAEPVPVELRAGWNLLEVDCRHDCAQRQFMCALTLPGGDEMKDALYDWRDAESRYVFDPAGFGRYASGSRRHTGIPSLAVAPKTGRLWVTYYGGVTAGEDSNNYCVLSTSADGGRMWKQALVADPDGDGPRRAFDPQVWIAPDGRLRWFWTDRVAPLQSVAKFANAGCSADPKSDRLYCVELDAETDPPVSLPEPACIARGVMMGKPAVLDDGTWLLPVAHWQEAPSASFYASSDGGRRFLERGGVTLPRKNRLFDEHVVAQLSDGALLTFIRGTGDCTYFESISHDRGMTWTPAKPARFRHTSSRVYLGRMASGRLLLVKHGDIDRDVGRRELKAFLSEDDGRTWFGGLMLDERAGVSYPDGDQAPDGTIYIVYDRNRTVEQEILFAAFREDDVRAGRLVAPQSRLRGVVQ